MEFFKRKATKKLSEFATTLLAKKSYKYRLRSLQSRINRKIDDSKKPCMWLAARGGNWRIDSIPPLKYLRMIL